MPLQNRVTPFGDIVAIAQRGIFTVNRGIIHDPATKTLLKKRWAAKAWLICVCEYKGKRRAVMGCRSWTELFFLDEAVALAAGHRPCFYCRRRAAEVFRAAWAAGRGEDAPLATEVDAVLHAERLYGRRKRVHALLGPVAELPDGTMITSAGKAYTIARGRAFRWTEQGYEAVSSLPPADRMLTPPSTVLAIRAGYRPVLHPDLEAKPRYEC